ncbi:MAG: S41 family peptidase [Verrucomicrobiales bacterium]|nr:S41 family peptidase [Verrucomicrobiales bacterium]
MIGTTTVAKEGMEIDAQTRSQVVEILSNDLVENYVFPDVAKQIVSELESSKSDYTEITNAEEFADAITKIIQSINNDRHLRVIHSVRKIPVRQKRSEPTEEEVRRDQAEMARKNYGFESVKRLEGNIGYIELRGFRDHELGEDTVAAAMSFIHNTDALIIDLRQNGGGSPKMVALISSYFFGDQKVHLNSIYWRKGDTTENFFTNESVMGKKYGNKDIYILTSSQTGSAAEGFSYHLRNLDRATIVGETTRGAAHPGDRFRLHEHFSAFIATGRAINPITKTNWEGVGVKPHISTSKEAALDTAIVSALEKKVAGITDERRKASIERLIVSAKKKLGN